MSETNNDNSHQRFFRLKYLIVCLVTNMKCQASITVENAPLPGPTFYHTWRVESTHWVAVFSVTWVMFILGVTLCVFITWYLSDMSCLHHALTGMLWLQYTNSVGVENCVDRWLASLQGSKHLQNVLTKLSNNILWNFYFLDSRQGSQGRMDSNQLILSRMLDQGI